MNINSFHILFISCIINLLNNRNRKKLIPFNIKTIPLYITINPILLALFIFHISKTPLKTRNRIIRTNRNNLVYISLINNLIKFINKVIKNNNNPTISLINILLKILSITSNINQIKNSTYPIQSIKTLFKFWCSYRYNSNNITLSNTNIIKSLCYLINIL